MNIASRNSKKCKYTLNLYYYFVLFFCHFGMQGIDRGEAIIYCSQFKVVLLTFHADKTST